MPTAKPTRVFATPHAMNVHAHFPGVGWKKVKQRTDSGVNNLCILLAAARAGDRDVTYELDSNEIDQVYL